MIGFITGIYVQSSVVKYFYYFIKKEYNLPNYISMLESGVLEALYENGVRIVEAVTSLANVQEMNDASLIQKFKVDKTMVLLRKMF